MVRDIGWLGERDEIIQARTLSLVRRVDSLSDDQVANSTAILELQPRMTVVVDALRVEVDGLHGSAATTSQEVQTLETALQEARAEISDIGTRLSVSESSERCVITCVLRMDEPISVLEQMTLGP
ncbi:hypothetical protein Tco_0331231 [Tanacetum coccineum]